MIEEPGGPDPKPGGEEYRRLLTEWRKLISHGIDEVEIFTKEKPLVGLAAAFFAGTLLGSIWRRR